MPNGCSLTVARSMIGANHLEEAFNDNEQWAD